jgi:hypothetical protein
MRERAPQRSPPPSVYTRLSLRVTRRIFDAHKNLWTGY